MIAQEERRNFLRMAVEKEVILSLAEDDAAQPLRGLCHDLSANGMSVRVREPIPAGTLVNVEIEGHFNMVEPLKAQTRVVRCDPDATESVVLGLEILSLS